MILDIVTLCLVGLGFYQGFSNGIIQTIFSALALFISVIAAIKLSKNVIEFLQNTFDFNPSLLFAAGFIITFLGVMFLVRYIGKSLEKLVNSLHIGGVNKLIGGLFLGMFYAVLISFGVYFMDKLKLVSENTKTVSVTYKYLEPLPLATQGIGKTLQPLFSDFWDQLLLTIDKINEKGDEINSQSDLENAQ